MQSNEEESQKYLMQILGEANYKQLKKMQQTKSKKQSLQRHEYLLVLFASVSIKLGRLQNADKVFEIASKTKTKMDSLLLADLRKLMAIVYYKN